MFQVVFPSVPVTRVCTMVSARRATPPTPVTVPTPHTGAGSAAEVSYSMLSVRRAPPPTPVTVPTPHTGDGSVAEVSYSQSNQNSYTIYC